MPQARSIQYQVALVFGLTAALSASAAKHCPVGYVGERCDFNIASLYFQHSVYTSSPTRPLDLQGWNHHETLYQRLASEADASSIAEVGVWKGGSSIIWAKWLKERSRGAIVSTDTWLGSSEMWKQAQANPALDLHLRHGFPTIFQTFLSNVIHQGVSSYVIPCPMPSRAASEYFLGMNVSFDLIHVDAGHSYEDAKEDIKAWWRNVAPNGIMLGDDYTPSWSGVIQAVDEFATAHGLTRHLDGVKWWFYRNATKILPPVAEGT